MKRPDRSMLYALILGSAWFGIAPPLLAETTHVGSAAIRWVTPLEVERTTKIAPDSNPTCENRVDRLMSEGFIALEQMPTTRTEILPQYPPLAKELGLEAHVVLQVFVDSKGVVRRARVTQESGHPYDLGFEKSALLSSNQWHFQTGIA